MGLSPFGSPPIVKSSSIMADWKENIILVDADHLDIVTFNLIVNFERMIGRRIPQADLCHWLDCIALDGGLSHGENKLQAIFVHSKEKKAFNNLTPSDFASQLNGVAFKDALGEFEMASYAVEEIVSKSDFFVQSLETVLEAEGVKRIMVVAALDEYGDEVKKACLKAQDKEVTLFTMEPTAERGFRQEILGYSLMSALGIRSDEL